MVAGRATPRRMDGDENRNRGLDWRRDWKWILILGAAVYLTCLGVRLLEVPAWSHPGLSVGGDPILATHDSYYWLAGAEGVRQIFQSGLGRLTAFLSGATGMTLAQVAFWFPAVLASFVAVATMLWGWFLAGRWAGLLAGLVGGLAPGFVSRTRLGYYDTDMFTLLMPMLAALFLAVLLRPLLRSAWLPGRQADEEEPREASAWRPLVLALGLGLLTRLTSLWHADLSYIHLLLWYVAIGLLLLLGRRGQRSRGLLLLAVFAMAAFPFSGELFAWVPLTLAWRGVLGWLPYDLVLFVAVLAAIPTAAYVLRERGGRAGRVFGTPWAAVALLVVLLLATNLGAPLLQPLSKLWLYLNPAGGGGEALSAQAAGPIYPSVIQSIIEAKLAGWGKVLSRLGPTTWISVIGMAGFLWVCWKKPLAAFLLPLLALALAGHWMGVRFTMFGGPAVALGLGVPLAWLTRGLPERWSSRAWTEPVVQLAAAALLLIPLVVRYAALPPTPVVDKPHAEALIELGRIAPPEAMVWTWWDWGYATQYYAKRMTVVDGGLHAGRDMYPVALALSTSSPEQANHLIRYAASRDYRPADVWDTMSAQEVAAFIHGLGSGPLETPGIAPQYLVVGWQNFTILEWISRFGNWDLVTGKGSASMADRIRDFQFDSSRGAVVFENGRATPVSSVDSLEPDRVNHKDFWGNSGPHLVFNKYRGDAFLMDDRAYDSVMVQLLLVDPRSVDQYFELVYEGLPHVRIYRVVGSGE